MLIDNESQLIKVYIVSINFSFLIMSTQIELAQGNHVFLMMIACKLNKVLI